MTQSELAKAAGINRVYMGQLERGEHSPTLEMIYRLLTPLNVTSIEFARELE